MSFPRLALAPSNWSEGRPRRSLFLEDRCGMAAPIDVGQFFGVAERFLGHAPDMGSQVGGNFSAP